VGVGEGVGEPPALSLQRRSRGGQRLRVEGTGGTACGSRAGRRRASLRSGRPAGDVWVWRAGVVAGVLRTPGEALLGPEANREEGSSTAQQRTSDNRRTRGDEAR